MPRVTITNGSVTVDGVALSPENIEAIRSWYRLFNFPYDILVKSKGESKRFAKWLTSYGGVPFTIREAQRMIVAFRRLNLLPKLGGTA